METVEMEEQMAALDGKDVKVEGAKKSDEVEQVVGYMETERMGKGRELPRGDQGAKQKRWQKSMVKSMKNQILRLSLLPSSQLQKKNMKKMHLLLALKTMMTSRGRRKERRKATMTPRAQEEIMQVLGETK